jgi:glycerophosphoryl diester phosphodiesterase
MSLLFRLDDLAPNGSFREGVLKLTDSCTLTMPSACVAECMLVSAAARYEGKEAPHIRFRLTLPACERPLYLSHRYRIGNDLAFAQQQWRVPPMLFAQITLGIEIDIPAGTVLYLRSFSAIYAAAPRDNAIGPRHNAHLGFLGMTPDNTMPAFELAALCGFPACIAVPKVTKDGVLVCLHDDTINRTGRHPDGSEIEQPLCVHDLTYEELLHYDFGIRKWPIYAGTKIPRLEEFFKLCARTGMRPMFSTHPALPVEKWLEVKEMLTRLGLLRHFHIKAGKFSIIKTAWEIFGSVIDGYTIDVQRLADNTVERMLATGVDVNACRVGVEIRTENLQPEDAARVRAAGMFAAAWNIPRCDFDDLYERFFALGITEFTEDHHCSMGLNY